MLNNFSDSTLEVFQIAEAYAKENMNAAIEPAHILKALLHKDVGLVSFIEKSLNADYYYILDWADMRIKMSKKNYDSSPQKGLSPLSKAVVNEADSVRVALKKESIDPVSLLIAIVTPGVGFTFEQLKTLPLQKEDIMAVCGNFGEGQTNAANNSTTRTKNNGNKNVATYCIWKNQEQIEGKLPEAVGFEKELNEIFGILGRKTKANILITGESGVGKTTLIHALVQAIVAGRVPTFLQNAQVYELDTIALSIGVSYKSEIESRMKKILDELSDMDNAILVIESFDQLMDKQGALNGTINLLKASLNQGLLCVCTSSIEGFTKNIETDKEITGKFERIILEEPSIENTEIILQAVIKSFEEFHKLKASDDLLINAIRLAKRYFSEKHLPESAIDLIDRTMALLKIKNDLHPNERKEIVGVEHLKEVVSQKTGIPLGDVQAAERERLVNAEEILKKRVVGQDHAIKAVLDSIYESRSGLNKKGQPIGSFFFLGPTGTGKTELAKSLAEFLFQDETAILRFDMSEYKEEHSVALLYGAPPGYVGYEEGGLLVNQIRQKPYSIVLFDEIEKAHRSVFDLFLQILDEGKLHDRLGRVGDFSNALIIFTSNIGSQYIFEQFEKGLVPTHNDMLEVMQGYFRPEFLARLTEIVPFAPINEKIVTVIFNIHLKGLLKTLSEQNITLQVDEKAIHKIAINGFNAQYGARPILGILRKDIRRPLSKMIISGELREGDHVTLALDERNELKWEIIHHE
ncbi:ATP-dependent Clp protease ATP-binding subunit [Phocaeicola sp. Sa1CVN1]|uniref:ATP-dependent Clp protease ATP-binding subunit n=1 Tax=Phocaeicola intestinalis TaxID=2762212 RepID=A0ABR8Y738_9BACT|nr:ATP-dependent Clp protease ATP-binding subunit [Phocaeicola intestinalis]MBD8039968.1 ATP-dependent Clp protease ATP-binding subunit [Phocaeicola intestinalis]